MSRITKIEAIRKSIKKLRIAAYARVSTDSEEQLLSLETQKEHYESYIKSKDEWIFAGLYFDEGISGTKIEKRTALLNLLNDCEIGLVDKIITKSISRFSRNTTDCLEMVRQLYKLGVYIYFEKENIDTETMSSELILTILSSIAESESRSISQNIKWSIKRRYESGTYIIATPPYGYKNQEGKLVIEPTESEIIKRIFKSSISGKGAYTIANDLNAENIKTRRNKTWHSSTVRNILTNEKYVGDAIFQKTFQDDNFQRNTNNGQKDMYYIENNHAGIISREVFEKASLEMNRRAREKGIVSGDGKYQNKYPFSKLIFCSECGTTFKRSTHFKNNEKVIYWACQEHLKGKDNCSMLGIKETDLITSFNKMMQKLKEFKNQVLKTFLKNLENQDEAKGIKGINDLNHKIEAAKNELNNISQLFTKGYIEPDLYHNEKTQLCARLKELIDEKTAISKAAGKKLVHINETRNLIKIVSGPKISYDDAAINKIIEKIEVLGKESFIFHLKCGLKLKEGGE